MIEKSIDFVMIEGNCNDRPRAIFYIHFPDDKMINDKALLLEILRVVEQLTKFKYLLKTMP